MKPVINKIRELSESHVAATSAVARRKLGQFFTDPRIAAFMATSVVNASLVAGRAVRVLDPGAGTGILGIAAASALLEHGASSVELTAIEKDPLVTVVLRKALETVEEQFGPRFSSKIVESDFLELSDGQLSEPRLDTFDLVIGNPPYFKMSPKNGPGSRAPNAYARFMHAAATMLGRGGRLCFIVPRSFASGFYYRDFRRDILAAVELEHIHVFDSRSDAFGSQGVLQENVIVVASRLDGPRSTHATVTTSAGIDDIASPFSMRIPVSALTDPRDPNRVLRIPTSRQDLRVIEVFARWSNTLRDFGLDISTGPVVPFRAADYLQDAPTSDDGGSVPLLWLQHVKLDSVQWPLRNDFKKPQWIRSGAPKKLLVPNATYVLLRRISSKEETRRLTAAVLKGGALRGKSLGLENHLNFIRSLDGSFDPELAQGICCALNSSLFDSYFRILNGNTQVGAAEVREIRFPPRDVVIACGRAANSAAVDRILETASRQTAQQELGGASDNATDGQLAMNF